MNFEILHCLDNKQLFVQKILVANIKGLFCVIISIVTKYKNVILGNYVLSKSLSHSVYECYDVVLLLLYLYPFILELQESCYQTLRPGKFSFN